MKIWPLNFLHLNVLLLIVLTIQGCSTASIVTVPTPTKADLPSQFSTAAGQITVTATPESTPTGTEIPTQTVTRQPETPTPPKVSTASTTPTPSFAAGIRSASAKAISLLASVEAGSYGTIQNVIWHAGLQNLLVQSTRALFMLNPWNGKILWSLPYVYSEVMFSSDDSELIVIYEGEIQLLNPEDGKWRSSVRLPEVEGLVSLGPNAEFVASTLGGSITLTDLRSGESKKLAGDKNAGPIYDWAYSADGRWLVAGGEKGDIQAWDTTNGQSVLYSPAQIPSEVYDCQVSGARGNHMPGTLLVICSYPGSGLNSTINRIGAYPASTKSTGVLLELRDDAQKGYDYFVANYDASQLGVVTGKHIEIWGFVEKKLLRTLTNAAGQGMAFNPKEPNQLLVWNQRSIAIWDVNSGTKTLEWLLPGAVDAPVQMAFSPAQGRRLLVVAREAGLLERWEINPLKKNAEWLAKEIAAISFSSDGATLAVAQRSGKVTLFDMNADRFVPQAEFEVGFAVNALAFAADAPAKLYIAGKSHNIAVWDVQSKMQNGTLPGSNLFELSSLALNDNVLAAGTRSGRVVLWRTTLKANPFVELAFADMSPVSSVFISEDERQVIFAQNNMLKIWDITTRKVVTEILFRNTQGLTAQLSPDRCSIAVQAGLTVELVDVNTSTTYARFASPTWLSAALAFSSDGDLLAAGDKEGRLLLFGAPGALQTLNRTRSIPSCTKVLPPLEKPKITITPRPFATLSVDDPNLGR